MLSATKTVPVKKRGRPVGSIGPAKAAELALNSIKKDAPAANYFVLCNGKPVKNVKELADLMDQIEDHVFTHHVSGVRNDFSAWVKDIFKDAELAQKIAQAKDKKHFQLVVYKHLTNKLW